MRKYTKKEIFVGNFIAILCGVFMYLFGTFFLLAIGIEGIMGIIIGYGIGTICVCASIKDMISKLKYNKDKCHEIKVLLVEGIIEIIPENIDILYDKFGIDKDILENETSDTNELYDFMKADAEKIEILLKNKENTTKYLVEFIEYGKIKAPNTFSEEIVELKGIKRRKLYITSNDKFKVNQLYFCDTKKYGIDFDIEKYKDTDFEWVGIKDNI